jgi:hypothetical protein
MAGRAMQEMPGFECRKNRPSDADKTELLMQEKLLSSCRGRRGDRHGSEFAVEGLVQEGLLQFHQGGEFTFVEASEVLGVYAQVVSGLLAVISAGIAQQAGESEGQQKLSGLMPA